VTEAYGSWGPPAPLPGARPDPNPHSPPPVPPMGRLPDGWHRLHPVSPVVRAGRGLAAVIFVILTSLARGNTSGLIELVVVAVVFVLGAVSWYVTRWRVEGGVLRIDSGLLRRTSKRFPLVQVQAIDTVRPLLARMFGVSELRLRMAGNQAGNGRLAYLGAAEADALRSRLLAMAHGLAEETPAPPEQPLTRLPTGRLLASQLLSGLGLLSIAVIVALVALSVINPSIAAGVIAGGASVLVALATGLWRQFNSSYHLTVAEAGDGLRLRSGLLQTAAETIPRGRVQVVRLVEPLLWRPFGWCRLDVSVAGKQARRRSKDNESLGRSLRSLLPVGSRAEAGWLLERVFPGVPVERRPAPARARWKSPLRFRHLSWGSNEWYAVATSGRLRRVTDWVPLSKVQSIRRVEGPIQRRLRLATVHLDTAGRNVHAVLRDRDRAEADFLMATLPERCAEARRRDPGARRL
jgi:putative membrane protein